MLVDKKGKVKKTWRSRKNSYSLTQSAFSGDPIALFSMTHAVGLRLYRRFSESWVDRRNNWMYSLRPWLMQCASYKAPLPPVATRIPAKQRLPWVWAQCSRHSVWIYWVHTDFPIWPVGSLQAELLRLCKWVALVLEPNFIYWLKDIGLLFPHLDKDNFCIKWISGDGRCPGPATLVGALWGLRVVG